MSCPPMYRCKCPHPPQVIGQVYIIGAIEKDQIISYQEHVLLFPSQWISFMISKQESYPQGSTCVSCHSKNHAVMTNVSSILQNKVTGTHLFK
jgi:hypothetical protein